MIYNSLYGIFVALQQSTSTTPTHTHTHTTYQHIYQVKPDMNHCTYSNLITYRIYFDKQTSKHANNVFFRVCVCVIRSDLGE